MTVADLENKRAARKEALAKDREVQYALDLEALDGFEIEHGDSNVSTVRVPFTPGLPTMAICRCPKPVEMKRYRSRIKSKKGVDGDPMLASEELAAVCRIYPDDETYNKMCEARPGLHVQLGTMAANLSMGSAEDDAK